MQSKGINRIEFIDFLRGFVIIIMVMGHIGFSKYFDYYIHMFHMPIWFFISGYFFSDRGEKIRIVIYKKIKALIVPYIIWGLLQYPAWILLVKEDSQSYLEPIKNFLWVNTNLVMPVAGALWFLTALFFAEIIFLVLRRKIKKDTMLAGIVAIIALFGCIFTSVFEIRLPWALDSAMVAVGFIYLGYVFKKNAHKQIINKLLNLPIYISILLLLLNAFFCFVNGYINMRTGSYGLISLFWFNALTAIIVYWNLCKKINEVNWNKFLNFFGDRVKQIGKNSIIYLCLNQLIILIVRKVVNLTLLNERHWLIQNIIIFIISIILLNLTEYIIMHTKACCLFGKKNSY